MIAKSATFLLCSSISQTYLDPFERFNPDPELAPMKKKNDKLIINDAISYQ